MKGGTQGCGVCAEFERRQMPDWLWLGRLQCLVFGHIWVERGAHLGHGAFWECEVCCRREEDK